MLKNMFNNIVCEILSSKIIQRRRAMIHTHTIRIKYLLRDLGIPPHILGYLYCAEAINYMASYNSESLLINDVYSYVASIYNTSEICVESSIRNAVKKAAKSRTPFFRELFKNKKSVGNHIFLTTLRDVFEEKNFEFITKKLGTA